MSQTPKSLGRDPIVEAVFEVRFESAEASFGDLLPGMLFQQLKGRFGSLAALPLAQLPKVVRQREEAFAFQATNALVGNGMRLALGDRVAALSLYRPYPGWGTFRPVIQEVVSALAQTGLISSVSRFSLKYLNVLTVGCDSSDLSLLRVNLSAADFPLKAPGRHMRFEIEHAACTHIVQVMTGTEVKQSGPGIGDFSASGVVVDVDTIRSGPFDEPWQQIPMLLNEVHAAEKEVFFGILAPAAIERMAPIYG